MSINGTLGLEIFRIWFYFKKANEGNLKTDAQCGHDGEKENFHTHILAYLEKAK